MAITASLQLTCQPSIGNYWFVFNCRYLDMNYFSSLNKFSSTLSRVITVCVHAMPICVLHVYSLKHYLLLLGVLYSSGSN